MVARGEDARGLEAPEKRKRRRRLLGGFSLALVAALVFGVPEWMLTRGTAEARLCLAQYEAPRGPEKPRCSASLQWFLFPARVPWTASRARYRAEELGARIATLDYVDASVGTPDETERASAADALDHAATVVQEGSLRVSMAELGRSIGAPDPGRDADALGDRRTLVTRGEAWLDWRVRLSTIRATLLSGDVKRAEVIAKRYAEYDPRDQDIRTALAALFCMGDDPSHGLAMLPLVQDDRASHRYEGMSRDYGEVRALLVACAARAGKPPPLLPTMTHAGNVDASEARAALRLRLTGKPAGTGGTGGTGEAAQAAIAETITLLEGTLHSPFARVSLLASVLAAGAELDEKAVVRLGKPGPGEEPLARSASRTAIDWLAEPRRLPGAEELAPLVASSTYVAAAGLVAGLEAKKDLSPPLKEELMRVRGAFWLEAAAALAREGDMEAGLGAAGEACRALGLEDVGERLLRSNVRLLCGDREHAYQELFELDKVRPDAPNGSKAGAAALEQRAELALSQGKRDDALASASRADAAAKAAHDVDIEVRAAFLLATLGAKHAPLPVWEDIEAGRAFPWLGFGNPLAPWRDGLPDARAALVDRALAPFVALRAPSAPANLRRAARFAFLRERGDAPPWLSVHFALVGALLDPAEGDPEVWLDAATALDMRRFSLRSYAFARAEAARMRGDAVAAGRWEERYRFLRGLATYPSRMDLARHLDI